MLTTSHYTINLRISAAIPLASAPKYGRFPRFHHGCTALQPTWRFLHRTREMLFYCRLIIPEALRHGGDGWLEYDRTFWCQAAVDPSLPWHSLVPGLQAATILNARPSGGGSFARFAASPITQPVSVPFQLSSLQSTRIVAAGSSEYLPLMEPGKVLFSPLVLI